MKKAINQTKLIPTRPVVAPIQTGMLSDNYRCGEPFIKFIDKLNALFVLSGFAGSPQDDDKRQAVLLSKLDNSACDIYTQFCDNNSNATYSDIVEHFESLFPTTTSLSFFERRQQLGETIEHFASQLGSIENNTRKNVILQRFIGGLLNKDLARALSLQRPANIDSASQPFA